MASTIGTARATTQGSWRPLASRVPASPLYFAVDWAWLIVAGDLKATLRKARGSIKVHAAYVEAVLT